MSTRLSTLDSSMFTIYRVRGYQFRFEGKGGPRKNPIAYRPLDVGKETLADAVLPSPDANAEDLEQQGFAKKAK